MLRGGVTKAQLALGERFRVYDTSKVPTRHQIQLPAKSFRVRAAEENETLGRSAGQRGRERARERERR